MTSTGPAPAPSGPTGALARMVRGCAEHPWRTISACVGPRRAIMDGVKGVGRVIVGAAVIMGVVFFAFVLGDDRIVKSFGLGLGVAILVDALLVRLILVPAVMHLLGRHAWYIPRWLDRVLPRLTIEPPEAGAATHDAPPSAPAPRAGRAAARERLVSAP